MKYNDSQLKDNINYLEALSKMFPSIQAASTEIIRLEAILNLPKGTEHFMSDIHGEYEAFAHILNNASGAIREKVDILFDKTLSSHERAVLATLIYYPEEKLKIIKKETENMNEWYRINLYRLLDICRLVASKYTRLKVSEALPEGYEFIITELLNTDLTATNKEEYYENILSAIIELEQADNFIIALCTTIKRLIVDCLHIVGDIYDRGPRPDIIMDSLISHHCVDIQWGNHDILWMGAACGSRTCITNALNNAFSYNNLEAIEIGYGISLRPLALFATKVYGDKNVSRFMPKNVNQRHYTPTDIKTVACMHKAIAIIQFKLEGHIIKRNPWFHMEDRLLLHSIDYEKNTICLKGKEYPLLDTDFPTIDRNDPYALSSQEEQVMEQLQFAFLNSEKLQKHVRFLYSNGGLYKKYNNNLLFHGCIPMNEDGSLMEFHIDGKTLCGKSLMDAMERIARDGYYAKANSPEKLHGKDFLWFLWCGNNSPLFGRTRMTTFERLFIDEPSLWEEPRNAYYNLYNDEGACVRILNEFGLDDPHSHIINGHIPVNRKKGESPIKANGRLIVIDGGFSKAYQPKTGTAGYTLVYNSYGIRIISHEPFVGINDAISGNKDILSTSVVFDVMENRIKVGQTDEGQLIKRNIEGLKMLLAAYQAGIVKEVQLN